MFNITRRLCLGGRFSLKAAARQKTQVKPVKRKKRATGCRQTAGDYTWIDVSGEGKSIEAFRREAKELYSSMGYAPVFRSACEEPEALPRYIKEGEQVLIIMRLANYHNFDDLNFSKLSTWSVSELTNRYTIVIDYERKLLGTLHVAPTSFTKKLENKYRRGDMTLHQFKWAVMHNVIRDNTGSITANQRLFDACERQLVTATHEDRHMAGMGVSKNIYSIMRRCSVSRMMLTETYNLLRDMKLDLPMGGYHHSSLLRLEERLRQSLFYVEETHTSSKDLLSLHFGTASHRTNELVRLLTLLNAIFIPLSFIAGFYGMNFEYMPGVGQPLSGIDGVWCIITLMLAVSSGLMFWFRSRGWL